LSVVVLLHHKFPNPIYQRSRELDPIVGVSATGIFDFFVKLFGSNWLLWWEAGRPENWLEGSDYAVFSDDAVGNQYPDSWLKIKVPQQILDYSGYAQKTVGQVFKRIEEAYLSFWREIVEQKAWEYCDQNKIKRPNRCTTVQPSGCLTKEALRVFDQGLMFADEHMDCASGEVDLSYLHLTVRKGVSITSGIANEKMDLVKVTLENGRELTMTPNHRLSIDDQWIPASDLKEGMEINVSLGEYQNATECGLDYVPIPASGRGRAPRGCFLPPTMSPQLAYFIGAAYGNGSFSENKYRIRFSHGNIEVLKRLSDISFELFGLRGSLNEEARDGKYELCFANKQLYQWFTQNDIDKKTKSKELNRIPLALRKSSRRSILAFFAGLIDTDGCIRTQGNFSIDSAAEAFMRHLQQVGEAVGLCFSFYINDQGENLQLEGKKMFGLSFSRMQSDLEAIAFINQYSVKAKARPVKPASRKFSFTPYKIAKIEVGVVDYTYDYAINGEDDDDSWYWQGALKSHNTKSLLTGASPGWHPPKGQRYIRRITCDRNDPVALACLDYGYSVVPAQGDKDENGYLLTNPFDPRCTEWLIEIPCEVAWANIPGVENIDVSQFSPLAQIDFYMQVQKFYVRHNTSATIELRVNEIDAVAQRIYEAIHHDEGYISACLSARFDDHEAFPRLPFEPIDKETYDRLVKEVEQRRVVDDFQEALAKRQAESEYIRSSSGPAGCDSDKCLMS
jgi:ribonucleotide reductase class II